ncbi:MAG: hypothetical protein ACPL07_04315 [Candidatus Bathyarchaeia archaeon]
MVQYNPMEEVFLKFLEEEESLYNHQLDILEKIKDEHRFSIGDLTPYKSMLNKLSTHNMKTSPYRASFIVCQVARMVHTFLTDLKMLLKEYAFKDKEEVLNLIDKLLEKAKEIIDAYYQTYGVLPYPRFYEKYYSHEREKFLPYYDYYSYYSQLYPEKKSNESLKDTVFRCITTKDDGYDSTQFVPASFQGTQGELDQYMALQTYKKLKEMQSHPLALEDDRNLPEYERLLNKIRKGEWKV